MQTKKTHSRFLLGLGLLLGLPVAVVLVVLMMGVKPVGTPLAGSFTIENHYRFISAPDGRTWRIMFQWPWDSTFEGDVRHVSEWHDESVPFMTHDILVTSGGYADPALVDTSVRDHHYYYSYKGERPKGSIDLLHIFPANAEILAALGEVEDGAQVRIRGREIFLINLYDADGEKEGFFTDTGCTTILVRGVEILPEQAAGQ